MRYSFVAIAICPRSNVGSASRKHAVCVWRWRWWCFWPFTVVDGYIVVCNIIPIAHINGYGKSKCGRALRSDTKEELPFSLVNDGRCYSCLMPFQHRAIIAGIWICFQIVHIRVTFTLFWLRLLSSMLNNNENNVLVCSCVM